MKGTGAKRNVCPGSCVSTGAKFPVAPVESAPMPVSLPFVDIYVCKLSGVNSENGGRRQRNNRTRKKRLQRKKRDRRFCKVIISLCDSDSRQHVTVVHQPMKLTAIWYK